MEQKKLRQRFLTSSNKIKAIIAIVLIAAIGLALHSFQTKNAAKNQRPGSLKPVVDVIPVGRQDMLKKIELTGQTVSESQVDIAAKYAGKITQVNVKLGDYVTEGQVLIVQDTSDLDISIQQNGAALRQADADTLESNAAFEANYQKAQADYQHYVTNYQRYQTLYEQGAVSKEALDNAEQQMISAKAAVDTWAKQLMSGSAASVESKRAARDKAHYAIEALVNQRNDLVLRAPRSGVIGYRQAEVGAFTSTGQKLLSIIDNSKIYIDCTVAEQDIGQITLGMPTTVAVESLGKTYAGKIIYISPAMTAGTQNFTIRIALDQSDDSIKAGMFARTNIEVLLRPQTLFVPKEAIVSLNGKDKVFVIDNDNKVSERIVKLGLRNDTGVEVIEGITEGERVALTNLARLKSGMAVTANAI